MEEKKKGKVASRIAMVILIAVFIYSIYKNRSSNVPYQFSQGMVWTTEYHITYQSDKQFDDSIQAVLMKVDNSLSMFNKQSLVTKINTNQTDEVDPMFIYVYNASAQVNKETNGAFDPTVSPLVNAWGFGYKSGSLPTEAQIDSIRQFVGFAKTKLAGNKFQKSDERVAIDFSAIAKGYGCDEVGRMLERNGVENYMVEIGGEISSKGANPNGGNWRISVDKPIESNDSVIHQSDLVLEISNGGIATSGNYRNYKVVDGKKVAHTINPATGFPEMSNLLSVTIVADNCMLADAYATSCMVMGLERSKDFLKNNPKIGALLISSGTDGKMQNWTNSRFDEMIKK